MTDRSERVPPWPSVTPVPFTDTDDCYWRDGKPWCPRHRGVVVQAKAVEAKTDGGTHVCPRCMEDHLNAHRAAQFGSTGDQP